MFDEQRLFREITTAIAMMENWMVWVNDLISFYKEFDDQRDQTSLVNNYCHVEDLTTTQGLEKLTRNTLRVSEQIVDVFADKDPLVVETLTKFMHGYVTWHLCDARYRMSEIYAQQSGEDEISKAFRGYYEEASKAGKVDPGVWAIREPKTGHLSKSGSWSLPWTFRPWHCLILLIPAALPLTMALAT